MVILGEVVFNTARSGAKKFFGSFFQKRTFFLIAH
jgi:hypothetical protein